MNITKHFSKRVKDRLGLSKKLSRQFFTQALKYGLYIEDFKSYNECYIYLNHLLYDNIIYDLVVYNRYIIVYTKRNKTAITILNIPYKYNNIVDNLKRKGKERCNSDSRTNK